MHDDVPSQLAKKINEHLKVDFKDLYDGLVKLFA